MLYLKSFTFNLFSENTYVVYNNESQAWIVDPGMSNDTEERILVSFLEEKNLQPQAIINTHAHIDHILGVNFLKTKYNIPFYLHPEDNIVLANARGAAAMFGMQLASIPEVDAAISVEKELTLGEDKIELRHTPGHAPGHVVLYYKAGAWLIGGDVLFQGSIGRTDLPGGDFATLDSSIRSQLYTLPPDTIVYSGHGAPTTIGEEMQSNPFVKV